MFGSTPNEHIAQGTLTLQETCLHIRLLELHAVQEVCRWVLPFTQNLHVQVMSDNMTTVYINKRGGTQCPPLCIEAVNLWKWCICHNATVFSVHLSGVQNTLSDSLSRHFPRDHMWELHDLVIWSIFHQWGISLWDLFEDLLGPHKKKKCPAWGHNSRDDAILVHWSESLIYTFLPVSYHRSWGKSQKMKQCWSSWLPCGQDSSGSLTFSRWSCLHASAFSSYHTSWPRTEARSFIPT